MNMNTQDFVWTYVFPQHLHFQSVFTTSLCLRVLHFMREKTGLKVTKCPLLLLTNKNISLNQVVGACNPSYSRGRRIANHMPPSHSLIGYRDTGVSNPPRRGKQGIPYEAVRSTEQAFSEHK